MQAYGHTHGPGVGGERDREAGEQGDGRDCGGRVSSLQRRRQRGKASAHFMRLCLRCFSKSIQYCSSLGHPFMHLHCVCIADT